MQAIGWPASPSTLAAASRALVFLGFCSAFFLAAFVASGLGVSITSGFGVSLVLSALNFFAAMVILPVFGGFGIGHPRHSRMPTGTQLPQLAKRHPVNSQRFLQVFGYFFVSLKRL